MKTELERAEKSLGVAVDALKSVSQGSCPTWIRTECCEAMERVAAILNPPPEMEPVELTRWAALNAEGEINNTFKTESQALQYAEAGRVVPLTGTYQRPKPVPVERSVSVEGVIIGSSGHPIYAASPSLHFPEAAGKKVTLTATWQEQGDKP